MSQFSWLDTNWDTKIWQPIWFFPYREMLLVASQGLVQIFFIAISKVGATGGVSEVGPNSIMHFLEEGTTDSALELLQPISISLSIFIFVWNPLQKQLQPTPYPAQNWGRWTVPRNILRDTVHPSLTLCIFWFFIVWSLNYYTITYWPYFLKYILIISFIKRFCVFTVLP